MSNELPERYTGISVGGLASEGAWPGIASATITPQSSWDVWNTQLQRQKEMKDAYAAAMRAYEQQRMQEAHLRSKMSKREMCAGILKEVTAMRERLDQLVAALATEVLTEEEPAPQSGGAASYSPNGLGQLAQQSYTAKAAGPIKKSP